jgi:hypothetical protein
MIHLFPGSNGLFVGLAVFPLIWTPIYFTREHEAYNLDPQNKWNAFEPFLVKYLRVSEFIIGLATGSIVLLVGSSALHGPIGKVPPEYSSPLFLLASCVGYGIVFMVWLTYHYEDHQHGVKHTKLAYTLSLTLGFSSLTSFFVGYIWLIFRATQP